MQPLALHVDAVDPGDHARPVQLDQGPQQGREAQQVVAGAGTEAHQPAARRRAARLRAHRLAPVDVVEERSLLVTDHLQEPHRVAGEGALDLVEAPLVLGGHSSLDLTDGAAPVALGRDV